MRLNNYLNERKGKALPQSQRRKINKEVQKLLQPTYFKQIPLQDLFDILDKYGIVPVQEDNTYWSGMLAGGVKDTVQTYFELAWKDSKEGKTYTEPVNNAMLALSYYKMPSGKYEVIGYIT
jgi:hypothetical protein